MQIIQQILFITILCFSIWFFVRNIRNIRRNILMGRDVELNDNKPERWRRILLLALGQKKMFKYPLAAVMHFVIYAGFIIINIEILEIILDGIFGTHRLFAPTIGPL